MLWWTLRKLKSENHKTRREAVWKLGEIGGSKVFDPILAALSDRYWGVREAAAMALGKIGDKRAIDPLITALKDEDKEVRRAAAQALEQLGPLESKQALSEFRLKEEQLALQERKAKEEKLAKEEKRWAEKEKQSSRVDQKTTKTKTSPSLAKEAEAKYPKDLANSAADRMKALERKLDSLVESGGPSEEMYLLEAQLCGGSMSGLIGVTEQLSANKMAMLPMYEGKVRTCASRLGASHPVVAVLEEMLGILRTKLDEGNKLGNKVQEQKSSFPRRTLRFPTDRSMGKLELGSLYLNRADTLIAAGTIEVEAGLVARLIISEAGAKDLSPLSKLDRNALQRIDLNGTWIEDDQLAHLQNLTGLRVLALNGTNITDAGLKHLKGLTKLESLELGRNVTEVGVAELKRFLPNCKITR